MEKITCLTVKQWHNWLSKNHEKKDRVMLIRYKKHTGKPSFNQMEAMHEAICFGWIDTTLNRIDDEKYGVAFVKRKKTSKWSNNTIKYGKELIKQGRMSPFGLKMFQEGLSKPTHDAGLPKNPIMPEELKPALDKNKKAKENFEKFSPSTKKMFYRWIIRGKRQETRYKRIKLIIKNAKLNKKDILTVNEKVNQ